MRHAWMALLLVQAACSQGDALVVVRVTSSLQLPPIGTLQVTASVGDRTMVPFTIGPFDGGTTFNLSSSHTFGIDVPSRFSGNFHVHVDALDLGGAKVASGDGNTTVNPGQRSDVLVTLGGAPADGGADMQAGCQISGDCGTGSAPICDPATHKCRGCTTNGECGSRVCDIVWTSPTHGACVPATAIVYVDQNGMCADSNNGETPTTAICSINAAVGKVASNSSKTTVHLGAGTYAEDIVINNVNVVIAADPGTTRLRGNQVQALQIQGTSHVTLMSVTIDGATGAGILCSTNFATLVVQSCIITLNSSYGIDCAGSSTVTVDSSQIGPGNAEGIRVGGNFTLTNNLIIGNVGGASPASGIYAIGAGSTRAIVNNTIANNRGATFAVSCPTAAAATVLNNVLYNNTTGAGSIAETNCATFYCATDDLGDALRAGSNNVSLSSQNPGFVSATDYHLQSTSVCKDKGSSSNAPNHDIDGQPRPDGTTTGVDIGADELE